MLFVELATVINAALIGKGYCCDVSINTGNCNYTEVYRNGVWICHYTLDNQSISIGKIHYHEKLTPGATVNCFITDPNFVPSVIENIERWWTEHNV